MYFIIKNYQRILIVAGLFLLIFAFTGCQEDHIFRWGETVPKPYGNSFLVLGDSRSGDRIYMDIVNSITSSFSSSSCLINTGDMADELHQLFTQYGVDIVFSGHEHQYYIYQKDSIAYVVTGGGGAPIYTGSIGETYHHYLLVELLPPNEIFIHVLDVHGKVIQTDVVTIN